MVNIGIGGSDLGPAMAYEALKDYAAPDIDCRFVSNVDPVDLWENTHDLDPAETMFVVCSKTFTTTETLTNAAAARDWLLDGLHASHDAVAGHFIAVSTNAGGWQISASTRRTRSCSGIGWVAATRMTPRSASR